MTLVEPLRGEVMDPFDLAMAIERRPTRLGEHFSAVLGDAWDWTFISGAVEAGSRQAQGIPPPVSDEQIQHLSYFYNRDPEQIRAILGERGGGFLTEDEWQRSPHFREGLTWEPGTTARYAEARADEFDERAHRAWLRANREGGVLTAASTITGSILGAAADPINYVPLAGPAIRAAAVARLGTIGGRVAVSAGEAAVATAITEPAVIARARYYGEDVGWADAVLDIALGALVGAAFGGATGVFARRAEVRARTRIRTQMEALHRLNEAVDDLAHGRPIDVNPNLVREARDLGDAWDRVAAQPRGPWDDPLVHLEPEDLDDLWVARGGWRDIGDPSVGRRGLGIVKMQYRHGPESGKPPGLQVTRWDLQQLPRVVREREPAVHPRPDGELSREWRVTLDHPEHGARQMVFADAVLTARDGRRHLVTGYVVDPRGPETGLPDSPRRGAVVGEGAGGGGPRAEAVNPRVAGTAGPLSRSLNRSRTPSTGDSIAPEGGAVQARGAAPGEASVRPRNSTVDGDPQLEAAEELRQALAETTDDVGLDPETGAFDELGAFEALVEAGRVRPDELAAWRAADAELTRAETYDAVYQAAAHCLARS